MGLLFGTTGIEKEATVDILIFNFNRLLLEAHSVYFSRSLEKEATVDILIFNFNRLLLEAHSVYFSRSLQFPRLLRRQRQVLP
jgi:hypothetical protein